MLTGYLTLLGVVPLLLTVFWALFAELLPGKDRGAAYVGAAMSFAAAGLFAVADVDVLLFGNKVFFTADSRLIATAAAALGGLWMLWTAGRGVGRIRESVALAALSMTGVALMASAFDMVVAVLALELASMPTYILIGYRRHRRRGLEGSLKYFLLSVLTQLFMVYGLSIMYGLVGTTNFEGLFRLPASPLSTVAVLLVLIGLFGKLSVAAFHYWAPDAYEGAEPWIVAYASAVPKLGALALATRVLLALSPSAVSTTSLLIAISILSMILGAFAALNQTDLRRLLAYSGVVNAGYMLIPLATFSVGGSLGSPSRAALIAIFYSVIYAIPGMGILLIAASEGGKVADLRGLSQRRPAAAASLAIFALSLVGVPPLAGFFGKFYLFTAGVSGGQIVAVVIAVIMSVVSAFYYLRIIKAAYFDSETGSVEVDPHATTDRSEDEIIAPATGRVGGFAIAVLVAATVVIGPASGIIISWLTGA